MSTSVFSPELGSLALRRKPDGHRTGVLLLDKNEQSEDLHPHFKQRVLDHVMEQNWHRYPPASYSDIEEAVADYCGLYADHITLGPGSASIITTMLNYFAVNRKHLVITQPSYSLFEYHCKSYGIPFSPWTLNSHLEFDLGNVPALSENSVVILTSPNNPVGNVIKSEMLEGLLQAHPDTLFLLDGVYTEFSDIDLTPVVLEYSNLMVLRSFSKAFPAAGLRLGYLCAASQTTEMVRKLMLQFSINAFTLAFARTVLFDPAFQQECKERVCNIILERERVRRLLHEQYSQLLSVYHSFGNFLAVRFIDQRTFDHILKHLSHWGVRVFDTSGFPLMDRTFRVSIGSAEENERFLRYVGRAL